MSAAIEPSFSKLFDLSGRVALVTGAGAGFGEAISLAFAEYGCDVVCADINLEAVKGTSAKVAAKGQRSAAIQFDLGKPEDVEGMVDAAVKALGSLDILVNCGGVLQHDPSESLPLETWNRVIDVNLRGTFLCCQSQADTCWRREKAALLIFLLSPVPPVFHVAFLLTAQVREA